ncbi:MAG TPA: ketoacyl-ACP synthase III family protein [Jatrophihabitans sp.]|nr:ketoacyl-ACP synthase III family protein [Jatrophihabitans sp.]
MTITPSDNLRVAGIGCWLPPAVPAAEAVRRGDCDQAEADRAGMVSVTVDDGTEVPAEFAARAARVALRQARSDQTLPDPAILLHAHLYDQGNQLWSPAGYVQRRAEAGTGPAVAVQQVSNGGMAALDLAAGYLRGRPGSALVTTGDRYCQPGFDRWHSDPGTVYADGGTALVLSNQAGFARLTALATVSDSTLEGMHRVGPAAGAGRTTNRRPVQLGLLKDAFVAEVGSGRTLQRIVAGQQAATVEALELAGLKLPEIDWFVLPHFGRRRLRSNYLRYLEIDLDRTNWPVSRAIGHLGAGDQIASVEQLLRAGLLQPGQRCLLFAVGAGFTWSAAVLELDRFPYPAVENPVFPLPNKELLP